MIYWQLYKINSKFPFWRCFTQRFWRQHFPGDAQHSGCLRPGSRRKPWRQQWVPKPVFSLQEVTPELCGFWYTELPTGLCQDANGALPGLVKTIPTVPHRRKMNSHWHPSQKKKVSPFNCLKDLYLKKRLSWDHNAIEKRAPVIHKEGHSFSVMGAPTVPTRTSASWVQGIRERGTWPGKGVSFEVQAPQTRRADQLDKYWAK